MKKLITLLLALILVCSLLPMTAFAAFNPAEYQLILFKNIVQGPCLPSHWS